MEDLQLYLRLLRRWVFWIALAALLGGSLAYVTQRDRPATYSAEAVIAVGGYISLPNPTTGEIRLGRDLAETYAFLATTSTVLKDAVEKAHLPVSPNTVRNALDVYILPDTSLLVLRVTYTDPAVAADIANAVAEQLIANSPTNLTPEQQSQIELANAEIAALQNQIQETRQRIEDIDSRVLTETDPKEVERLATVRNLLVDQMNMSSATIAEFSATIVALQQRTNSVDIVERADVPSRSSSSSTIYLVFLSALISAGLATGGALLREYLNDTITSTQEIMRMFSLPVLGEIHRFGKPGDNYARHLIAYRDPDSPVSESYRAIRTQLLFAAGQSEKRAYIITSPGPKEGKTVTVANLAVAIAAAGYRVILVDADLRQARIHECLGVSNEIGLAELLSEPSAGSASSIERGLKGCIQNTSIEGLRVITSGKPPSNPSEILGSAALKRLFDAIISSSDVDIILFDTPPALFVADCAVLAATIGVPVVMVLQAGRTRRSAALRTKEEFEQLGIELCGVILNQVKAKDLGYGYGRYASSYRPTSSPLGQLNGRRKRAEKRERTKSQDT